MSTYKELKNSRGRTLFRDSTQHVIRSGRSTTTALLLFAQHVAQGFYQRLPPLRTVAMVVEFSNFFDTVDHTALLRCIHDTIIESTYVRWLCIYLRARTASCSYKRRESPKKSVSRSTSRLIFSPQQNRNSTTSHFICRQFHSNSLKPKGGGSCLSPSKSCGKCWCVGRGKKSRDISSEVRG